MATIRTAQPFTVPVPRITDVSVTAKTVSTRVIPADLSADRAVVYGIRNAKEIVQSVDDGLTWTIVRTHPLSDNVRGFWLTPDGEAMYSTESAGVGQSTLNKSTGWAENPSTAT